MITARQFFPIVALVAIFFILPKISVAAQDIIINEIFSDPKGNDTGLEWIELYNASSQTIDLTGWQIGIGNYFTFPSYLMPANSYLLIRWHADGQNTSNEIFTGTTAVDINLSNSSGFIAFFNSGQRSKNTIVDYLEYGKADQTWETAAWQAGIWTKGQFLPATGANKNQSLGLKQDGQDGNITGDWQIFSNPTPGKPNNQEIENNSPPNNITNEQSATQQKISQPPQTLSTASLSEIALQQITNSSLQNNYDLTEQTVSSTITTQKQVASAGINNQIDDQAPQTSKTRIFLALAAVIILSAASGVFLMIFRRKKAFDPVQKP
jgi:hypothetical protein